LVISSPDHDYRVELNYSDGCYIDGYVYKGKKTLKRIKGSLLGEILIEDYETSKKKEFLPTGTPNLFHLKTVEKLENQKDFESRKLWAIVNYHTIKKNHEDLEVARDEMELKREELKSNSVQSNLFELSKEEVFNEVPRYKLIYDNHPFKDKINKNL
jgi:hypothetical protein